jgi:cell wall-associated NlpC family hydrolase
MIGSPTTWHDLLLKRYRPRAEGPEAFDCWGLCREMARRTGRSLPSYPAWVRTAAVRVGDVFEEQAPRFERLTRPAAFCLVAFRIPSRGDPGKYTYHVGTVLPDCKHFIHARSSVGITISPIDGYGDFRGFWQYADCDNP